MKIIIFIAILFIFVGIGNIILFNFNGKEKNIKILAILFNSVMMIYFIVNLSFFIFVDDYNGGICFIKEKVVSEENLEITNIEKRKTGGGFFLDTNINYQVTYINKNGEEKIQTFLEKEVSLSKANENKMLKQKISKKWSCLGNDFDENIKNEYILYLNEEYYNEE